MNTTMRASLTLAALIALSGCNLFKGRTKTPVIGDRVPILLSERAVEVDPALAAVQVQLPAATANADWAQPGGSASKSLGHLALGASPARLWTAQIAGGDQRRRLAASPVVANGRLYVVDVMGVVQVLDAATGARVWNARVAEKGGNENSLFGGGVSVEGDRVFATNGNGEVAAFNVADGAVVWRARPTGPLRGAPTLFAGQVYVLSQDNQLVALNASDGQVAWTTSGALETSGVFGVAAPAGGQGTIVTGYSSGELNAYRYENGRVVWQDALSRTSISTSVSSLADIDADPVIDSGRVFAIGQGGRMVSLELTTGQRVWEQNIGGISTPWVAGEWVFVVTDEGKLLCLSRANGRVRWIRELTRWADPEDRDGPVTWIGPILAGNRLILVNNYGRMIYVSPETGLDQASIKTEDSFTLSPIVANNILYLIGDNGRISAYR